MKNKKWLWVTICAIIVLYLMFFPRSPKGIGIGYDDFINEWNRISSSDLGGYLYINEPYIERGNEKAGDVADAFSYSFGDSFLIAGGKNIKSDEVTVAIVSGNASAYYNDFSILAGMLIATLNPKLTYDEVDNIFYNKLDYENTLYNASTTDIKINGLTYTLTGGRSGTAILSVSKGKIPKE